MKTKVYDAPKGGIKGRYIATRILLKASFNSAIRKIVEQIKR